MQEQLLRHSALLNQALHTLIANLDDVSEGHDWLEDYRKGTAPEDLLESAHPLLMEIEAPDADTRQLIADIESEVG